MACYTSNYNIITRLLLFHFPMLRGLYVNRYSVYTIWHSVSNHDILSDDRKWECSWKPPNPTFFFLIGSLVPYLRGCISKLGIIVPKWTVTERQDVSLLYSTINLVDFFWNAQPASWFTAEINTLYVFLIVYHPNIDPANLPYGQQFSFSWVYLHCIWALLSIKQHKTDYW